MHIHFRIHHWVLWWFYVGVVCGVVALVNILSRDLSRTQERVILVIGMMFWLLGGLVAHAYDGVKIESRVDSPRTRSAPIAQWQRRIVRRAGLRLRDRQSSSLLS